MKIDLNTAELQRAMKGLATLPDALKNSTLVDIFRIAARPIVSKAKANAPKETGTLKKSIGTRKGKSKKFPLLIIGPMANKGGYHGHLLEKGTQKRFRKSGGATGSGKAFDYMENAYTAEKSATAEKMQRQIIKLIDRNLKKYGYTGNI